VKTTKKPAAGRKAAPRQQKIRTWYPTGWDREDAIPVCRLPEKIKQQISCQLKSSGLSTSTSFFNELEKRALFVYFAQQEISEVNSPRKVREALKKARVAATKLKESLERLPDTAKFLTAPFSKLLSQASDIEKRLHDALEKTDDYPISGALPDDARLLLAVEVAHAMRKHLHVKPTSTKAGLYEEILTIVLGVAIKREPRQVNTLARRVLTSTQN
jgi:hypothetical protein